MEYVIHLLILVCLYVILAQGFNLSFGTARLFNLAHVAVYSIGAYATALLATEMHFNFWGCLAVSMILAITVSLLIGWISLKLSDDYFAIGTIAFSAVVSALLINWKSLTRGVLGIPGIPRPEIFGITYDSNEHFLSLIFLAALIVSTVIYLILNSSYGRKLRAQGEYHPAAHALGIDVTTVKLISFMIASCAAGVAGAFYAYYISFIDPSSFQLTEMIFVLTLVVVGKPGSFWGVMAATAFLVLLPEPLRFIDMPSSILGPLRQLLYAVILAGVVYLKRAELFPVQRGV